MVDDKISTSYFAGAIDDGRWAHCPVTLPGLPEAKFKGTVEEFKSAYPQIKHHMINYVKVCPACGKNCGNSVIACNNCATSLSGEPLTVTPNALMAFVYGIKAFPTSIRFQDENFLVYDDIMQTTLIHFNAIPTHVYVPDFRFLFQDPQRGLGMIESLFRVSVSAACRMMINKPFVNQYFSASAVEEISNTSVENFVKKHVLCGFNFPPSQCQLHLQFVLPPYTPYHAVLFANGRHTDLNRFFPFKSIVMYLHELKTRGETIRMSEIEGLSAADLVGYLSHRTGVDYNQIFHESVETTKKYSQLLSNWKSDDFNYLVTTGKNTVSSLRGGEQNICIDPIEIQKKDRNIIQSYGKGMGLQFYVFAKDPGTVPDWNSHVLP